MFFVCLYYFVILVLAMVFKYSYQLSSKIYLRGLSDRHFIFDKIWSISKIRKYCNIRAQGLWVPTNDCWPRQLYVLSTYLNDDWYYKISTRQLKRIIPDLTYFWSKWNGKSLWAHNLKIMLLLSMLEYTYLPRQSARTVLTGRYLDTSEFDR